MTVRSTADRKLTDTWRYALIGGVASIPLTVGFYWLSGTGNELSLNMIFFGGLLAGNLARTAPTEIDSTAVGLRAGIVGSLPAVWLLGDLLWDAATMSGPVWFRVVGVGFIMTTATVFTVVLAALVGLLGAKVDSWLAKRYGRQSSQLRES